MEIGPLRQDGTTYKNKAVKDSEKEEANKETKLY